MSKELADQIGDDLLKQFLAERERLDRIDKWLRWEHDAPHAPRASTREYKELSARSQTPWLSLVVTAVAQNLYVEGYRRQNTNDDLGPWNIWQANGFDGRQIALHRAAIAYGASYMTVLPGRNPVTGDPVPAMRGVSPRRMLAFYEDPAEDDWPTLALRVDDSGEKRTIRLYDETQVHWFTTDVHRGKIEHSRSEAHDVGLCPVVRFCNQLDLEGRTDGEVEPYIPVAGRIDQTIFDRLVVQRFGSWKVRTIAGMAKNEVAGEDVSPEQAKLSLRVEDLLVAEDPDTKFGTLSETPLNGYIDAADADIKVLAAVSQTPAHEMLGQMANLSAEALAAARASLTAKVDERKHALGESHEQALRLAAYIAGDAESATDYQAEVRWKDTEIRSLAQAADALGKMAQMLSVPVEVLWEKIPGWTQQDVDRAKALVEEGGGLEALMRELADASTQPA